MSLWKEIARTMFAIGQEDEYYGGGEGAEPSQYELEMAARKQQREMDRQLKAYGREAMELDPKLRLEDAARGVTLEDHQKSLQLRMPGSKPPKKDAKDPLRDLMKQMKLTMGPDILEETAGTNNTDTKATVVELPQYDDRGPAPLKNPQKAHVRHPNDGAHGLCLTTGFCGAWVGGVSSGKSTCLQSCLAHNHARYRYTDVFLMHPDAENAKTGEYGLCTDIKVLEHWPRIEEWEKMAPGRTALICDDISWQLSKKGTPSQYALAERCLGYMRSHKKGSMDVYIGQQQIFGIPSQLRKLVSTWFIFPRRTSPQTHTALAQACMIDRATLRKCLDFVDGDYGFLLVNNLADGRPRCRVNGWRAVRGLL